jgi:hypothetical protein
MRHHLVDIDRGRWIIDCVVTYKWDAGFENLADHAGFSANGRSDGRAQTLGGLSVHTRARDWLDRMRIGVRKRYNGRGVAPDRDGEPARLAEQLALVVDPNNRCIDTAQQA